MGSEKKKLFIKDIIAYRPDFLSNGYTPTKEEQHKRLENFLGRKFEKNGIFADFATGEFIVYKYPFLNSPYQKSGLNEIPYKTVRYNKELINKQEIYIAYFKDGELIKFVRDKQREKEFANQYKDHYKMVEK